MHTPKGVSVVDGGGETPGPIPNPEAKPARADGTAPGREWESRLPPTQQLHTQAPATQPFVWRVPSFGVACLRGCALRTTRPTPTIGVHPRIVRINTTPPPTQNRPGQTRRRRRFVHNRCPAWPPRRPLALADFRIADNTELANNGYEPTNEPGGEWRSRKF